MSLTNKTFDQLEEADLQELIENQVPERKDTRQKGMIQSK